MDMRYWNQVGSKGYSKLNMILSNKKEAVTGKNKINISDKISGFLNNLGDINANSDYIISNYIPIEPNTQYYISGTNVGGAFHVIYDSDLNVLSAIKDGAITTPNNAAYIRLSININANQAQMELGSVKTTYEPFTDNYDNEQKIKDFQNQLDGYNAQIESLEIKMPKMVIGKNLFDSSTVVSGFLRQNGTISENLDYVTSDYIPVEGGKTVTAYPLGTGPIQFCQYDSEKSLITYTQNKQLLTVTLEPNTAYIRATFKTSNYATEGQIEYGNSATEYEPFKYIISEDNLPSNIGNGATPNEVRDIISNDVYPAKIVLPANLYFKVGRENNLYFKQAIKSSCNEEFDFSISNASTALKVFDRQIHGNPTDATTYTNKLTLRRFGRLLQELNTTFHLISSPTSAKSVKILDSGDSISDLGGWQVALKQLLESDNVTVKYIGTMINRVNIGTSQSSNYAEDIWGEVQSGGNMSFITEPKGAAKILTVSGITELPVTGYPGTSYLDENDISWVVRGFKMAKGTDGKYNGKLKLGKFSSDPNYGDGTSDDTSGTGDFPPSGTLTKTQSENGSTLAGDTTITYTSADDARYNPFWNPSTDELDFQYYFDYWGFEVPDIFIMQWGYNEVQSYQEVDDGAVETAIQRAKTIMEKFHAQYPETKIVFGIEIYGREIPGYGGGSSNNNSPKKYSVLSLAERLISLIEDDSSPYKDYVFLVPVYAFMDLIYGYGNVIEQQLCSLYSEAKTLTTVNGKDGVHPPYDKGLTEIGRAYESVVLSLIN